MYVLASLRCNTGMEYYIVVRSYGMDNFTFGCSGWAGWLGSGCRVGQ